VLDVAMAEFSWPRGRELVWATVQVSFQ